MLQFCSMPQLPSCSHSRPPPWPQVHEATTDLTANMNQEHCVCMTFVRDTFGWVLTPYQASRPLGRGCRFGCGWGREGTAFAGEAHCAICLD